MMRELVIQPLPGIGDMVWHLPLLQAIASLRPRGRIDLLAKRRSHADQLFRGQPWCGEVLWLERERSGTHAGIGGLFSLARNVRMRRYERVWVLHHSLRYGMLALLAGIPTRYGYGVGAQRLLLNAGPVLRGARKLHPLERQSRYLYALNEAGILPGPVHDQPRLVPVAQPGAASVTGPGPVLAYGIGCSEANRRWPIDSFVELIARLMSEHGGTHVILGGESDRPAAEHIRQQVRIPEGAQLLLCLEQPLDRVAVLLAGVDAYVGNDSGLLNVAAALGRPVVCLLGHPISTVLLQYFPTLMPVYPVATGAGMRGITVESVHAAVGNLL